MASEESSLSLSSTSTSEFEPLSDLVDSIARRVIVTLLHLYWIDWSHQLTPVMSTCFTISSIKPTCHKTMCVVKQDRCASAICYFRDIALSLPLWIQKQPANYNLMTSPQGPSPIEGRAKVKTLPTSIFSSQILFCAMCKNWPINCT